MDQKPTFFLGGETNYRCIIVDDDPSAIEILKGFLKQMPEFEIIRSFTEPLEALSFAKASKALDFVFLDVEMPILSGIDLAAAMRDYATFIIFTTGHSRYAEQAYDVGVDQFLVKPFTLERLKNKLFNLVSQKNQKKTTPAAEPPPSDLRFVHGTDAFVLEPIDLSKILYVESDRNHSVVYFSDYNVRIPISLKAFELSLDPKLFIRVARSYILAAKGIRRIEGYDVLLDKDVKIPVGIPYRAAFKEFIRRYRLNRNS